MRRSKGRTTLCPEVGASVIILGHVAPSRFHITSPAPLFSLSPFSLTHTHIRALYYFSRVRRFCYFCGTSRKNFTKTKSFLPLLLNGHRRTPPHAPAHFSPFRPHTNTMERCKEYFISKNAAFLIDRIRSFDDSSATVELAAVRFECKPAEIAKSLSFLLKKTMTKDEAKRRQRELLEWRKKQKELGLDGADGSPAGSPTIDGEAPTVIMIVTAGDAKVNTQKYKDKFNGKPDLLKRDKVEELTGFPPGAVCPFGVNDNVKVYLDISMKRFEKVFPAAGTANSGLGMTPDEVEQYASNVVEWVDICDGWQPESEGAKDGAADAVEQKKQDNEAEKAAEGSA